MRDIYHEADCEILSVRQIVICFYRIWKNIWGLVFYEIYIFAFYMFGWQISWSSTCWSDGGITRKYKYPEVPRSTLYVLVTTQRQVMRRIHRNNSPTTTAVGHRHNGAVNDW